MDGDAYAEESATLDELRILEDLGPAVNDGGPPRVMDVVTDAAPAEADSPDADPEADTDPTQPSAEQTSDRAAAQPAAQLGEPQREPIGGPAAASLSESAVESTGSRTAEAAQLGEPAIESTGDRDAERAAQPGASLAIDLPPAGPREEPAPPVTGDDAVDAATAEVADTAADPLETRLAAYERAHRTLQDRLADVEG